MEECGIDKNWAHFFQTKVVQKLKLSKSVNTKFVFLIQYSQKKSFLERPIQQKNDYKNLNLAVYVTSASLHFKKFQNFL